MIHQATIPARRVLSEIESTNQRLGHENLGSLSEAHGFLPSTAPLLHFPTTHHLWDEIAAQLPALYHTFALRRVLDAMPVLCADPAHLPDQYLLRASTLLATFAHAYHWLDAGPYTQLPSAVQAPWEIVSQRLGRRGLSMTFIEVHTYNWRLIDPTLPTPRRLENMRLLFPVFDIEDEHVFVLEPVEMHDYGAPVVGAVVRAQEAAQRDDPDALMCELTLIRHCLQQIAHRSFAKINLNPHSPTHVDPVVWAKTFGIFGLKIPAEEAQGAGGAAAPLYHLLDSFFEREQFESNVGRESMRLRSWFPPHWQALIAAAGEVSTRAYVERVGNSALTGAFQETFNALAGDTGIINRHRLKAYPFISMAVKAGRNTTVSGSFSGTLKERMWNAIDKELESTRVERTVAFPESSHHARIKEVTALGQAQQAKKVLLDISQTGITYHPGDLCAILPEQSEALVDKTLQALGATGEEPIQLDATWRKAVAHRPGYRGVTDLPLRTLLRFGHIRPVDPPMVRMLFALTHHPHLQQILASDTTNNSADQWELWDLLAFLTADGFDPRLLWQAPPGAREHICRLVLPETFRTFSISSALTDPAAPSADELQLTISQLSYQTKHQSGMCIERRGTMASFLDQVAGYAVAGEQQVAFQIIPSPHFALPEDPRIPIVMFAGGSGIAPFRGFIQARMQQEEAGDMWLFFATRERADFYYAEELAAIAAQGKLHVHTAFSREDSTATVGGGSVVYTPGERGYIDRTMLADATAMQLWALMRSTTEGGLGAHFYICGRTGFARTVLDTLKQLIDRFTTAPFADQTNRANPFLYRLIGEGRLSQDIFTTYAPVPQTSDTLFDRSEIALHNDETHGYWIVIDNAVYDVTEFIQRHPGGAKIIRSYAGMDGTEGFQKMRHHMNPGVMAQLLPLRIGTVREPQLGDGWAVGIAPNGLRPITLQEVYRAWVHVLNHIVELENALYNTFDFQHHIALPADVSSAHSVFTLSQNVAFHNLFLHQYLPSMMGEDLETLWALTVGLWAPQQDVRWMGVQNEQHRQNIHAQAVAELVHHFDSVVKRVGCGELAPDAPVVTDTIVRSQQLEQSAKNFMRSFKAHICAGVQTFETLDVATVKCRGEQLLSIMETIPLLFETFYGNCSALTASPSPILGEGSKTVSSPQVRKS